MTALEAPGLLMFVEGARLLRAAGRSLASEGGLAVDVPFAIDTAIADGEAQLQALDLPRDEQLRHTVRSILQLSAPHELLAFLQNLVEQEAGGDLDAFLRSTGTLSAGMLLPRALVYVEVLQQLSQQLSPTQLEEVADGGAAAIATDIEQVTTHLTAVANERKVDLAELRTLTRQHLAGLDTSELIQVLEQLIDEAAIAAESLPTDQQASTSVDRGEVPGPLLFVEMATRLLDNPNSGLTPDRRLDLQSNREKAAVKLAAMERIGRLDNRQDYQEQIQTYLDHYSPPELLQLLEEWFEPEV